VATQPVKLVGEFVPVLRLPTEFPKATVRTVRFEESLHDGIEGGAEGGQESILELGIGEGQAGQGQRLAAAFFHKFALLLASGDQERVPVDLEAGRGPVLEPYVISLQKQLEPGHDVDLACEQNLEVFNRLAACILFFLFCG